MEHGGQRAAAYRTSTPAAGRQSGHQWTLTLTLRPHSEAHALLPGCQRGGQSVEQPEPVVVCRQNQVIIVSFAVIYQIIFMVGK